MAFDDATRSRLQRFVSDARDLLSREFYQQFQEAYGLDPKSGTVTDLSALGHLPDDAFETARVLREIYAHYTASEAVTAKPSPTAILDRMVREQAFTVLNRLAAIRMMEARGIVIEAVAAGYQSKGFQLYRQVAGTALGETGETYRWFLLSLCDVFVGDLPTLFDRHSPFGLLFAREPALLQLLELLNAADLEPLWGEDETIGWIYQYFNSREERKAMRDASQAPRNSRELAVRNQFFTPRYVVEFLVDNTLGRLWFNWTGGQSKLRDKCQYLLVRPDSVVFGAMSVDDGPTSRMASLLLDGRLDDLPAFDTSDRGIQAMIEFSHCVNGYDREPPQSDDRPAGSAYVRGYEAELHGQRFDGLTTQQIWDGLLFECRADRHGGYGDVYKERWFATAVQEIVARLRGERDRKPELIRYPGKLRDPRTIKLLDPACGSMHFGLYAFDLFLEIYKEAWAWEQTYGPGSLDFETGGNPGWRPLSQDYADEASFLRDVPRLIVEYNIYGVDIDARAAQISSLALWLRVQRAWHDAGVKAQKRPRVGRGQVIAAVAPPAEPDLRRGIMDELEPIDAELFERTLVMLRGLPELGMLLKVEKELPALVREVFGEHGPMFAKEDVAQWLKAEVRLRAALTDYARAVSSTYRGRLFADDALYGLRMIDHDREVFDTIVMNPPFGAVTSNNKSYLAAQFPLSKNDLLSIFVDRGIELLRKGGFLGAITSRTCFYLTSFQDWREQIVLGNSHVLALADLGHGVMDDAMVEAAAYILRKR